VVGGPGIELADGIEEGILQRRHSRLEFLVEGEVLLGFFFVAQKAVGEGQSIMSGAIAGKSSQALR